MRCGCRQTRRASTSAPARRLPVWLLAVLAGGALLTITTSRFPGFESPARAGTVSGAPSWRIEVRPQEATNPVRAQQLIIATVYDEKGVPRRNRKVEWTVEGVGTIIEVDESGLIQRGHKVDSRSAVSYTAFREHLFTRGNQDPSDDFMVRPGQTFIIVSSAVEGDTHITAHSPDIESWENHHVVVTTHWVDASWRLPPPAVQRAGTPVVCTTQVFRPGNQQPLPGYRVRYRILDGPPAFFLPGRGQEEFALSDLAGNAGVTLVQTEPRSGINRIGVEVIQPPVPSAPAGTIVGQGETQVDWQGPQISLSNTAPPTAPVGSDLPLTLNVSNTGQVACQEITLREPLPEGVQLVRSNPPAIVDGNQLVWTLPALPGGKGHTVQAVLRSNKPGPVVLTASARTHEGLTEQTKATTEITVPQLAVKVVAAEVGIVGVPLRYDITVSNPGNGPAPNVQVVSDFDTGLEHDSKANPLRFTLGPLQAGESKVVPLALTPRQAGQWTNRVSASGDGNLKATGQHVVTAKKAELVVEIQGTDKTYQNRPADWTLSVTNKGETPLTNVQLHDQLPPELAYTGADPTAMPAGNEVVWNLGNLAPNERRDVHLKTTCVRLAAKAINSAYATADLGIRGQAQATIEINGLPAFHLEVHDLTDPVEVGGRTTYRIDVENTGTLAGSKVALVADVPPEFRIIQAIGPGQARFEGQRIAFPVVETLPPGQKMTCTVDVQALKPGDVRFRVEMRSAALSKEIVAEESTTIFGSGPAPAGTTPEPPRR